jgi:transposase
LNLSRFEEPLKTRQGAAGRAAWDPRLLVSVWVYSYSEGISSAREIERWMEWEPGLRWLSGGFDQVNHHTLSDFRVAHREALEELFVQMLSLLQTEGLLSLERVMHDGTKIRTQAGGDTFRREKTLREHLQEARRVVAAMGIRGRKRRSGTGDKRRKRARLGSAKNCSIGRCRNGRH